VPALGASGCQIRSFEMELSG